MAEMRNLIFGTVIFAAILTGFFLSANDWISRVNPAQTALTINESQYNITKQNAYLSNWANESTQKLTQAQAVPYLGGGLVLIQGAFQVVTLLVNLPGVVVMPMANGIMSILQLPSWLTIYVLIGLAILIVFGVLSVMLARPV